MNRLEELLQEYCPDGVEYKKLGDIATDVFRGSGITRNQVSAEGTPCVRYGEIYTDYNIYFDKCNSHTNADEIPNKKYFEYGDILFAITGESVEDIAKSCAYVGTEKCLAGGDIVVMKHTQDPKYIAYALETADARMQKSRGKVKSKVVHSSVPAIQDIEIPVPPLPVQREIVRILDEYTKKVTELNASLEAELTARKKQFEYYRDELLIYDDSVEWKELSEIFDVVDYRGKTPKKTDEGIFLVTAKNIRKGFIDYETSQEYISESDYEDVMHRGKPQIGDLLFTTEAPCGNVALVDNEDIALAQRVIKYHPKNKYINTVFYKHYLLGKEFQNRLERQSTGGTVKGIKGSKLHIMKVPVPSLEEQNRVAQTLNNFDLLCADLKTGLPAEITARKKQYEHYRDKLLTFKRKN